MSYEKVLARSLLLDFFSVFIWLVAIILVSIFIKKILPLGDPSNNIVRKIVYAILISGSVLVFCLSASEAYHIARDIQDELYISADGSFTTNRDRMYFKNENGEQVLLKIRPILPDVESCEKATIVYSKNSRILLEVILN